MITQGKRGLHRVELTHRMGDDDKVKTEGFCVSGALPPSCVQVSGNAPFGWRSGHGDYYSHSDNGAMAEIIPVPLLACFRLLGRSRPT